MKILKISALIGATMLAAPTAMASSILIDTFDVFQEVVDVPTGTDVNSSQVGPEASILGGFRTLTVMTDPVGNEGSILRSTGAASGFNPPNALTFSNASGQRGVATVVYDGNGAGLGDLTGPSGLLDSFFFEVLDADLAGTVFRTTVVSGANSSTFSENFDATFDPFTRFSSFDPIIDFTNVASLTFEFDTQGIANFDGALGSISVVPLPASILFLLGGLGGLAGVSAASKRRRKA